MCHIIFLSSKQNTFYLNLTQLMSLEKVYPTICVFSLSPQLAKFVSPIKKALNPNWNKNPLIEQNIAQYWRSCFYFRCFFFIFFSQPHEPHNQFIYKFRLINANVRRNEKSRAHNFVSVWSGKFQNLHKGKAPEFYNRTLPKLYLKSGLIKWILRADSTSHSKG